MGVVGKNRREVLGGQSQPARADELLRDDADLSKEDPVIGTQRAYLTLLFNKYRGPLYRYITGMVSSKEDAADLLQESYYRLLRHSSVVRLEVVARAYLFRIATNLARDYFRRRTSHCVEQHVDIARTGIPSESLNPERELGWDQTLASVRTGIRELAPLTRRVFLLSRLKNKTYPEIAALLGISTRTVERRMSEAIEALASRIGKSI